MSSNLEKVEGIFDPTASVVDGKPDPTSSHIRVSEGGGFIQLLQGPDSSENVSPNFYKKPKMSLPQEKTYFLGRSFWGRRLPSAGLWGSGRTSEVPERSYLISASHGGVVVGERVPAPPGWQSNPIRKIFEVSPYRLIAVTNSGTAYLFCTDNEPHMVAENGVTSQSSFFLDQNPHSETVFRPRDSFLYDAEFTAVRFSGSGWLRDGVVLEKSMRIRKEINREGFFVGGKVPGNNSRPITHIFIVDNNHLIVVTKSYSLYFCTTV